VIIARLVGCAAGGTMDIAEKVKEIISQQLDVDKANIKEDAAFIEDLGADSLAIVELVLAFEEQFEIDIPDEDTEKIRTVGDAVSYIQERAN
jgi:acyl carrier protein